jgi:hypothetical protein
MRIKIIKSQIRRRHIQIIDDGGSTSSQSFFLQSNDTIVSATIELVVACIFYSPGGYGK